MHDWDFDQGAIPRFLNRFVNLFPDETYNLLLGRIQQSAQATENNQRRFRSFRLTHENISFASVPSEKRLQLGRDCIARLIGSDSAEELADLFWNMAGYGEASLGLIVGVAPTIDERGVRNIATLIEQAIPRLAFSSPGFARDLLRILPIHKENASWEPLRLKHDTSAAAYLREIRTTIWPSDRNNSLTKWLLSRTKLVLRISRGHSEGSRSRKRRHSGQDR